MPRKKTRKRTKRTKKTLGFKPLFKFSWKRILATMFAGLVGIGLVEFIVGSAFMEDFLSSPIYNASAGLQGFIWYIIGASIIFGVVFYLLEQSTIRRTNLKEGLRLGFLYGVIAGAPMYILQYFLHTQTQAYMLGALIVILLNYTVAGGLAGFILDKMG